MSATRRPASLFAWVFVLFWSALTLLADGVTTVHVWRQLRATTYPTTEGVITRSEVRTEPGDEGGTVHKLDVAYDYEVGGRRYTGTQYCYAPQGPGGRACYEIRAGLPVGARVPVYYDPDDPADALLRPGVLGSHVVFLWFLTPFNLVMLGGWVVLARGNRPGFEPASATPTPTGWSVRVSPAGRWTAAAGTLMGLSFAGVFVVLALAGGNPPVAPVAGAYLAALAVAGVVAARYHVPRLEVDEAARVLRFSGRRGEPGQVPFDTVREVAVVHEQGKDSDGDPTHAYHCELVRGGGEKPVRVAAYNDRADAEALAGWLRERLGLSAG